MDKDATTNWPKWRLNEVEGPLKNSHALIRGLRVACWRRLRVSSACGRSEKEVPKVRWKGCIDAGQDCQDMVLERANGAFCPIAVMHVWRDKLEGGIPLEGDCFL